MAKTKGNKGKGVLPSSSRATKQRRVNEREVPQDVLMCQQEEDEESVLPKWNGGPLTQFDEEYQTTYFNEKMDKLVNKKEGFLVERAIAEEDFGPFDICDKFKSLGWEATLQCYDREKNKLYMRDIQEWVGTLKMEFENKSNKKMKLTGYCRGTPVVMSMSTLREIAKFDSKPANQYIFPSESELIVHPEKHPNWEAMKRELFRAGKEGSMMRDDLKLPVRLMLVFVIQNIMPRRGDRKKVRTYDVPILYSLIKGSPMISFRHIAMMNIWNARNTIDKQLIPHCRLIMALLDHFGVFLGGGTLPSNYVIKDLGPFNAKSIKKYEWIYYRTDRYLKLKHKATGQKWRVLKPNARPLQQDEEDESESDDSVVDEFNDDEEMEGEGNVEGLGPSAGARGVHQMNFSDEMWAGIQEARPPEFIGWTNYEQSIFDNTSRWGLQAQFDSQRNYDMNQRWHQAHQFAFQNEVNYNWQDGENQRMWRAWKNGEPVVKFPPPIDFTTLPPNDGSVTIPEPQVHHSEWIDPTQASQQEEGQAGGSSGTFAFSSWRQTLGEAFGPSQHRYYYH